MYGTPYSLRNGITVLRWCVSRFVRRLHIVQGSRVHGSGLSKESHSLHINVPCATIRQMIIHCQMSALTTSIFLRAGHVPQRRFYSRIMVSWRSSVCGISMMIKSSVVYSDAFSYVNPLQGMAMVEVYTCTCRSTTSLLILLLSLSHIPTLYAPT